MLRWPPAPRHVVTSLQRPSLPAGKLSVDVVGLLVGDRVTAKKPYVVWLSTVRSPVTPTASVGMFFVASPGTRFVTENVRATRLWSGPERPTLTLVSRIRFGVIGTYMSPVDDVAAVDRASSPRGLFVRASAPATIAADIPIATATVSIARRGEEPRLPCSSACGSTLLGAGA